MNTVYITGSHYACTFLGKQICKINSSIFVFRCFSAIIVYKVYNRSIDKPREVKYQIEKRVRKHELLYMIFHLPRFTNPIFYKERFN